jgi:hypothetical protein
VHPHQSRRYAIGLWLLLALFAFRVLAQPLSLVLHSAILPRFDSWQGAVLPYGLLLAAQLLLLTAFGWTAYRFSTGVVRPRRSVGAVALTIGSLYFLSMVARLLLGLTVLNHQRWFASPIPTIFHLVLAAWVLVYGHFHWVHGEERFSGRYDRYGG